MGGLFSLGSPLNLEVEGRGGGGARERSDRGVCFGSNLSLV